ncbi:MAG: hypothetical protein GY823_09920 [Flavobacteriaceae bacterium]|nr:hypothetical protein [Flavobacteriaceae bacterium]|tara:strand:+ start:26621 stop:28459 length:1839 start_codon:yes stop_codon:yes gene_type:complete
MSLVNEIIKGLLPEDEKRTVAVYGGGFKPPTNGHFQVVKTAIEKNPDIDKFIILIGGKERDGVTPEEALIIWDIYKQYLPINVEVELSSKPPIQAVYNYAKNHPDENVIFILGAREGNEDDFSDIAKRTTSVKNYPNLRVGTTVTKSGASGTAARNAAKVSSEKLRPLLPKEITDEEAEEIFGYVNNVVQEGRKKKKDPKKGTGKKPEGSKRRLYTDEDPKDTVGIKFSTRQDIVDTLNKKSFKAKSHARQSQIINLIHQRTRAAYNRAKDPAVKKRLKTGLDYITKRKEASKKKTQRLKKQKLNEVLDPINFDFNPLIKSLTTSMENDGLKLKPYPKVKFIHTDFKNADNFFGKTAYYDPNNNEVVLYTLGRHPKDILRSYAHELIHVHQNHENRLENISTDNVNDDEYLEKIEREAYEEGNIAFRSWTNKDPFGLAEAIFEIAEDEQYYIYLDMDGVVADFDKRFKDLSGLMPQEYIEKNDLNAFWDLIDEKHKVAFWRGIEIMPGAEKLVKFVEQHPFEMLTAPSIKKQSIIGKGLWVKDKVGTLYSTKPKVTYRSAKQKHTVKPNLTKFDILIDDKGSTIDNWNAAGGTGIFYQNADQVINDLKKLGL